MNAYELMREWLLDCFDEEYDQEMIQELNEQELERSVNRYYDGGLRAFMAGI